ncbi:MAG: hypothetical protein GWN01_12610, partial [Nitrosopumilaceae archaeon]|nr:hypothetical protein [Nitrosopumilaceae archaeon]NIV66355.1 hypothetical protein [Nitrosopumilaceae archaeon]NIX62314.1 hypothetical protein [Nitrosopumilaceae archaeon]
MRTFFFLITLLFISCSTDKTPSNDMESSVSQEAQTEADDSLQVDVSTEFVTGQFDFTTH